MDRRRFLLVAAAAACGAKTRCSGSTPARWQELSRRAGPLMGKKSGKKKPAKLKAAKVPSSEPRRAKTSSRDGDSFFGGSAYISSGCMLWPDDDLGIVVAINGGLAGEAVRAACEVIRKRASEFRSQ